MKIGYYLKKVEQYISTLNVKNMDTTRKATEDVEHVKGIAKKTQTTKRKIISSKPIAQTVRRNRPAFQELIYKRGWKIMEVKYRRNI